MDRIISKSFDKMISNYIHTLNSFYPARESTGFTEANQVHIYINALMSCLDDECAVSWLELPWEQKKHHIDGFIYSPKHKAVFYIEAKRLSHKKKKQEIMRDIERLHVRDKSFLNDYGVVNFEHEYAIAVSDVWLETKWKKSIPEWWCGLNNVPEQVLLWEKNNGPLIKPEQTIHGELKLDRNIDWSESSSYVYWLGENVSDATNYCLLLASSKI